jgi:hypothetical protein
MTEPRQEPAAGADEERLLAELARLVPERDPVPPDLIEMAKQSFTWRTVDAELAELVADSREATGAALVRSDTASVRLLTFATRHLELALEVLVDGAVRRLVGVLQPGSPARITVEYAGGSLTEDTDELGRFIVTGIPGGLIRLRCEPADGVALLTPWSKV